MGAAGLYTAGSIVDRQYGTALVDAVGPALLMGWSEIGPWMLRQIHAFSPADGSLDEQKGENENRDLKQAITAVPRPPVLPPALLARTRELDAEHRGADPPADLPRQPPRPVADRPRPRERPGRRRTRRDSGRRAGGIAAGSLTTADCGGDSY